MRVLGISVDDVATQADFAKAQKLEFELVADRKSGKMSADNLKAVG